MCTLCTCGFAVTTTTLAIYNGARPLLVLGTGGEQGSDGAAGRARRRCGSWRGRPFAAALFDFAQPATASYFKANRPAAPSLPLSTAAPAGQNPPEDAPPVDYTVLGSPVAKVGEVGAK